MLRGFGHPVVMCCDMLGVFGSNWKMVKFFMQHLWMLLGEIPATMLHPGMHTSSISKSQHNNDNNSSKLPAWPLLTFIYMYIALSCH